MNSLFGDASTVAATPQTIAEAESLFSGRSPIGSLRLNDDNQDREIPDITLGPSSSLPGSLRNGRPGNSRQSSLRGEGVGNWISNMYKRGQLNDGGSGRYKKVSSKDENVDDNND